MSQLPVPVILVEDDPDEKDIFQNFLGSRKDIALRAFFESGQGLFDYLENVLNTDLPGLIVLDHNMPRITGYQVLQQLKQTERFQSVPVVIYSTYVDTALAEKCRSAGALFVFTKPLTREGYNEMLDEVLQLRGNLPA